MDPRHDNPIAAGQRKRNSHPSCVSLSQHINLITSPHLRQRWGIWGHDRAFGMTRFWWDLYVCRLKSLLLHSRWGSLSLHTQRNVTQRKRVSLPVNRREKKKKHTIGCLYVWEKPSPFATCWPLKQRKKTSRHPLQNETKNLHTTRASVHGSSGGDCFSNEEL